MIGTLHGTLQTATALYSTGDRDVTVNRNSGRRGLDWCQRVSCLVAWSATTLGFVGIGIGDPLADAGAGQRLQFDPPAPSFGVIKEALNDDPVLDVSVRNESDAAFDLRNVQIGCGCMSVEVINAGPIAAGATGTVRVKLDRHRARLGAASYGLTVLDAKGNPIASVPVSYEYDPPVFADHTELFIDAEELAATATARAVTVVRVRRDGVGIDDLRVECDSEHFTAALKPSAPTEPKAYSLIVTCVAAGAPLGNTSAVIRVYLPGAKDPDLVIPLSCTIRPPVTAHPAALLLKPVRAGEQVTRTIRLQSSRQFSLGSISASSRDVSAKERQVDESNRSPGATQFERVLEVVIRPSHEARVAGTIEAEIRVDVKSSTPFQLIVPVAGEVTTDER